MPKAVIKGGLIYPVDPLPPGWKDGKEVWVEEAPATSEVPQDLDQWYEELNAMVAQNDPEDLKKIDETLRLADEQAKEIVRKEMGLP